MLQVFPDYYQDFSCIASRCRHSCCIGWEIDVDEESLRFYDTVTGELGERLQRCIDRTEQPHFILGEQERCPFLNGENLCDIYAELGEDRLCQICTDHPRFRCDLPGRIETGLGLCCEAAGQLILGKKTPMTLRYEGEREEEDQIIDLRDEVLALLQDRSLPLSRRVEEMLRLCGGMLGGRSVSAWAEELLELERLEEGWTELLEEMREKTPDLAAFDAFMAERETEYEQFVVYLVYRHLANASDELDLAARAGFAALGYLVLRTLGALQYEKQGSFSFDDQVELARRFSAEIEYSDENLETLLDLLAEESFAGEDQLEN